MSIEKRGVCPDEGEAPSAPVKAAAACCGARRSCGTDLMSKMADAVDAKNAPKVFANRDLGDEQAN